MTTLTRAARDLLAALVDCTLGAALRWAMRLWGVRCALCHRVVEPKNAAWAEREGAGTDLTRAGEP